MGLYFFSQNNICIHMYEICYFQNKLSDYSNNNFYVRKNSTYFYTFHTFFCYIKVLELYKLKYIFHLHALIHSFFLCSVFKIKIFRPFYIVLCFVVVISIKICQIIVTFVNCHPFFIQHSFLFILENLYFGFNCFF